MHVNVGWIIAFGIAAVVILVFWGRRSALDSLVIYRTLRHGDPSESRKYQIGKRLLSFAASFVMVVVFFLDSLFLLFLTVLAVDIPAWVWMTATILICFTGASFCVGFVLILPSEIAEFRREARQAHESGEGFWISRHSDG